MGRSLTDLIGYLRFGDPCDQVHLPTASEEDAPRPGGESSDEGEATNKEENLEEDPSEKKGERIDEEDPKEEPSEGEEEPMNEKDLQEDPNE